MLTRTSRLRPWQLKGDGGPVQNWASGEPLTFNLNNLPLTTEGNLANYLVGILFTAYGEFSSDGGGGSVPIQQADLCRGLFDSFEIQAAWHGRPLAQQHVRGATLPIIERIGCGYQTPKRQIVTAFDIEGPTPFRFSQFLPLGHYLGENPQYQAQLAALFTDAQLFMYCRNGATFTDSSGNVLTWDVAGDGRVQVRASAILLPEKSLRLAAGSEWIEYRQPAVANSDEVTLDSFGNQTALEGVEPGAGVDTCLALTSVRGQLGSFAANTLTQFSAPMVGITQTQHLDPLLAALEQASQEHGRPMEGYVVEGGGAFVGQVVDGSDFPYAPNLGMESATVETALSPYALAVPIIIAGSELQVSKTQTFEGTQVYNRTATVTGTDRTLVHQFKSWSPAKVEDHRALMISSGLAKKVLGTNDIMPRAAVDTLAPNDPRKGRFFPIEWVPATGPKSA